MDYEAAKTDEATFDAEEALSSFEDKAVRRGFIKKVYGIVSVQMAVTAAIMCLYLFVFATEMQTPYGGRETLMIVSITCGVLAFVILIAMACITSLQRKTPWNFIALGAFTVFEGLSVSYVGLVYTKESVALAAGLTAAIVLALTAFAFQTKIDFTACRGVMFCILMVFLLCGIIMIFLPYNRYAEIGIGAAGASIFSVYLIIDTQMIMGGHHKYKLSPEEYVMAAIAIYLDILNIFLYILKIVGQKK